MRLGDQYRQPRVAERSEAAQIRSRRRSQFDIRAAIDRGGELAELHLEGVLEIVGVPKVAALLGRCQDFTHQILGASSPFGHVSGDGDTDASLVREALDDGMLAGVIVGERVDGHHRRHASGRDDVEVMRQGSPGPQRRRRDSPPASQEAGACRRRP